MALAVAGQDARRAVELIETSWAPEVPEPARQRAGQSIDLDAASANCPACETPFDPKLLRCPGCGLRLG